jgi:phospholipase/lecithinase/hemolysin
MSTHLGKAVALALALSSTPAVILADPFTSVVVYGDSLSDNGNLFAASGGTIPGPPYFDGRRSNGPVAVEQLATTLGVPLQDFAWIGATTGIGNFGDGGTPTSFGAFGLPGMQTELAGTAGLLGPFLSSGLFVVWGGANDFLAPSPLDSFPSGVIARGVSDLVGIVATLQGLGAQHILVPGMPDLGLTPYFESLGPAFAAEGSAITDAFNAALAASLPTGVTYYNTAALLRQMVADPSAFGFTDVTDPCFNGITVCSNPDQYLFWDDFHPTTATDSFVAKAFEAAVPEPATIALLPAALMLCFVIRKRRRYQH